MTDNNWWNGVLYGARQCASTVVNWILTLIERWSFLKWSTWPKVTNYPELGRIILANKIYNIWLSSSSSQRIPAVLFEPNNLVIVVWIALLPVTFSHILFSVLVVFFFFVPMLCLYCSVYWKERNKHFLNGINYFNYKTYTSLSPLHRSLFVRA